MTKDFETQQWAVVTGASGGIGAELARRLAARGAGLVITARSRAALDALAGELRERHGVPVEPLVIDMSAPDAADGIAGELRRLGIEPTILVNNAGVGLFGLHAETTLEDEQKMINLNLVALTRLTKLLLPGIIARRGRILNVASTASFQPGPFMAVYYATKAYVLSYSEALAEELAPAGVTVTALCPGPTESGFQDKARMHASALVNGKRLPTAAEVAEYAMVALDRGQRVAVHGCANRAMVQLLRFLPRRAITRTVYRLSRPVAS